MSLSRLGCGPRRARAAVLASALAIGVLALSACGDPPSPTPTGAPTDSNSGSGSPTDAASALTDEQALAAATTAYGAYLAMIDQILADGGRDPDRIRTVATGDAADDFERDAADYQQHDAHDVGRTSFDSVRLQAHNGNEISFYVCEDVSDIDVLDSAGVSLVSPERLPRTPSVVTVLVDVQLVTKEDVWTGPQFC